MTGEPRRRYQVFISSTFEDLEEIRLEIIEQLFRNDCIPVGMEMFPASSLPSWDVITRMMDDSDCVVLVMAQRYGSGYTEKEFDYAISKKKLLLVFRQRLTAEQEATLDERMRHFRTKAAFDRQVREWDSTAKLLGNILADLPGELNRVQPEGWVRGGYSMSQHVSELKKTVTELTSNLETKLTQMPRIHELSETINTRVDAVFSLATEERRGTGAMSHYMRIQQLKLDLAEKNPMFATVADGLMEDPFDTLSNLAKGIASVPDYQIGHANKLLIDAIKSRFDAVSYDDLRFWGSEDATEKAYRTSISEATQRSMNPIIATRIFLFPYNVIAEQRANIAAVLAKQMTGGMGWAIAVEEDEKPHRPRGATPDFALFDRNRAVSYFRYERRFDVTFNTNRATRNGGESEIDLQMRAYRVLLTHCWLATSGFAQNHLEVEAEASLLSRLTGRTRALRELKVDHHGRLFPLIVEFETEIRGAIDEMLNLRTKVLARR